MTIETKKETISGIICVMSEEMLADAWNTMCSTEGRGGEVLHPIDEADSDYFYGMTAHQVHDEFDLSEFSWDDYWFVDTGWGALRSYCSADDIADADELTEYALEADEDFGNSDIRDILDEEVTETDEEDEQEETEEQEVDRIRHLEITDGELSFILQVLKGTKIRSDREGMENISKTCETLINDYENQQKNWEA